MTKGTETTTSHPDPIVPPDAEPPATARGRVRRKIAALEAEVTTLSTTLADERDKRLRLAAEYDNFRKRTAAEYRTVVQTAGERIIRALLPSLDDFDRLLGQDPAKVDAASVISAAGLIRRKFYGVLESEGLQPIPAGNALFDANLHEAVAEMTDPSQPSGAILAEAQTGYRLGDRVIRHSRVVVNNVAEVEAPAVG
ncbi:MAG: nucleotide exchange factor GrpE [Calditrichaeota bacterium]|nr:nucleotide exchange factor GrpE [Calditrichota bacterium]